MIVVFEGVRGPCIDYSLQCGPVNEDVLLCRWGIITHGGVDGFSRYPTFIQASNNNRAMTVLTLFVEAVRNHPLPVRVRADAGGENVLVQRFMEQLRGAGQHSEIFTMRHI